MKNNSLDGTKGKIRLTDLISRLKSTTVVACLRLLRRRDRRKIVGVILLQSFLSLMDLAGVAVVGVLGALAITGVASHQPGNRVSAALRLIGIAHYSLRVQAAVLGLIATGLLITRTLVSIYFTRRALHFLSRRGAEISSNLVTKLLNKSLITINEVETQKVIYSLTSGIQAITIGVLGTLVTLAADVSLLIVMLVGLLVVDPYIAISSLIFFSLIGLALYKFLHNRAAKLGRAQGILEIESGQKITEVLGSYREMIVRQRRRFYIDSFSKIRVESAFNQAELNFMPFIGKYIIETSVTLGALVISAGQFMISSAAHAIGALAIFLAAGTRIAPSVLRLQQSAILIRVSTNQARETFNFIELLGVDDELDMETDSPLEIVHESFDADVILRSVTFQYPNKSTNALSSIDLRIVSGSRYAIVGPSGAGKTTLVDVLLGLIQPDSGEVLINGMPPLKAIHNHPGAMAYVPQNVVISSGTIRSNIAFGYPEDFSHDDLCWSALELAQMSDFVHGLPDGLNTKVGEFGKRLSGGQRQRLGIARALFTKPKLIVLDEATSALDGESEHGITDAIENLGKDVTVITIAHRLSTVLNSDQVIYMESGKIIDRGTFEEVRSRVPNFDRQAKLMGL